MVTVKNMVRDIQIFSRDKKDVSKTIQTFGRKRGLEDRRSK